MPKFKQVDQIMTLPFSLSYPYYVIYMIFIFLSFTIFIHYGLMLVVDAQEDRTLGIFTTIRRSFRQTGMMEALGSSGNVNFSRPEARPGDKRRGVPELRKENVLKSQEKSAAPGRLGPSDDMGRNDSELAKDTNMRYYLPRPTLTTWLYIAVGMSIIGFLMLIFKHISFKKFMEAQAAQAM